MSSLAALYRYPLKSAIGQSLQQSPVDGLGLLGDRRWMLVDAQSGRFLSQRADPRLGQLGTQVGEDAGLRLSASGYPELNVAVPESGELRGVTLWNDSFRVPDAGEEAARWVSDFVGKPTRLVYVPTERARTVSAGYGEGGDKVAFADGFPLLLIGQGSLDDLSARVGRTLEMARFRPNLVVQDSAAFAEDGWKRIRIGGLDFRVLKPCARCILTTLDPHTGERSADREPLATLKRYRQQDGHAMFGQNLVCDGAGVLEVGMPITVLE
ncbi:MULTISPECIES: MOSC domain-containing protein [Pseudomonas]|uniref:MOSC domain-containing protein n=1 Tax=Pseudomonas baltica TaxID=2762576 RepID=A0A7X1G3N7_9PSED|nr:MULTISPECIES: MOSC domain-containing protein [Pseudomonas]MBC2677830.1 MOSC domain-containing protein [Pseudomonas baltica]MBD8593340.1 MOSC domain-containing protein [Pseudomonas sp. CFBP 8758]MBD8732499.1 MOSC domain-containing protein [Pseudomonas sp. CFBP 13710]MBD8827940.1 MOSC domain-containing protein [Pseudomonas sp. CFBP 13602]